MIMKKVDYLDIIFNLYYDELLGYKNWENIMIERYNILALAFVHLKRQELRRCEQTILFLTRKNKFILIIKFNIFFIILLCTIYRYRMGQKSKL